MVSPNTDSSETSFVYDSKLSTVVPASITGDDKFHGLRNLDLAMKLHYIRGIYFFDKDAANGMEIKDLKKSMFEYLKIYPAVSGRIRRTDDSEDGGSGGRAFIRCNDSGVRVVEAKCSKTIDQWLRDCSGVANFDQLVYGRHVLGPDLGFAPLVFVQFTWFKCGGISVGLSWSHILGDTFSATDFINKWGQILAEHSRHIELPGTKNDYKFPSAIAKIPVSIKMVDPVGDYWLAISKSKMQIHSLHLTAEKLNHLLSKASQGSIELSAKLKPFDVISAVIWKSLAKVRSESEPKIVTICRNDPSFVRKPLSNSQVITTVEAANLNVSEANLLELVNLIAEKQEDERRLIEEFMENDKSKSDYIMYGANLTFVDLEEAKIYDLEINGHKPVFANYSLNGVGDEGAVLVLPGPPSNNAKEDGRMVNLILPENEVEDLKDELRKEWSLF
ncbi:hypothetical protein M9H77_32220 [Catharanthus roseus]|uniref:Uncharacterized protein n=1 Tax=Catharanthus roseus TaxID=4058 RepID=A0ACC0A2C5_CATRO|nr:hypothetical protein M9H77_32220 [Catharanthus roseus]